MFQPFANSLLTIDLAAIAENYRRVKMVADGVEVAVVLKGNAYNLGVAEVASTLMEQGARCFFVAYPGEALELRSILDGLGVFATIYVLAGLHSKYFDLYLEKDLIPVLNSFEQIKGWAHKSQKRAQKLQAVFQVDLGLNRLGISFAEFTTLIDNTDYLENLSPGLIIGHLPFGNDHSNPQNPEHLQMFQRFREKLPGWRGSIAASSTLFLGPEYHQDMVRIGSALFGVNPKRGQTNPMLPVVALESRIIQVRELEAGQTVGYGGMFRAARKSLIGIVSIGTSDGLHRQVSLNGSGSAYIAGHRTPVIGSGGSDMIFVDLSEVPAPLAVVGQPVELLGKNIDVEMMAKQGGFTEYDILVGFNHRMARTYLRPDQIERRSKL